MIIWGLVLTAVGIAALADVSVWPIVLIALGVSTLLSVALRGYPGVASLFNCWQLCPICVESEPKNAKDTGLD